MKIEYILTPELRIILKEPFGDLIEGEPIETMGKFKELVEKEKPPKIISVGDIVSRNLHKYNISPQVSIIDNISLRKQLLPEEGTTENTVCVKNPHGTIPVEAISAIREALERKKHTHIVVEGEEDLLALVAILYAPENAVVIYGQPYSGIVIVKVTCEKKVQVQEFLNFMKASKS